MKYQIFNQVNEKVFSGRFLFHNKKDYLLLNPPVSIKKQRKQKDILKLRESLYDEICIHDFRYTIGKATNFYGQTEGNICLIIFIKKGNCNISINSSKDCILKENTYNLFYFSEKNNIQITFSQNTDNQTILIGLSENYILNLTQNHPGLFNNIHDNILDNKSFSLFRNGILCNVEINRLIGQLKESSRLKNTEFLYIEAKIQELIALLSINSKCVNVKDIPDWISDKMYEARYILEQNYLNPPGIDDLARLVGVSGTTMKTWFKQLFNNTVYGYLYDYRMKKAKLLLNQDNSLNISEIAGLTGYEHIAHFCTAFKRKYGISPKNFRQNQLFL